jgi:3'(2'), 5'-bisphosphate nucleotidase
MNIELSDAFLDELTGLVSRAGAAILERGRTSDVRVKADLTPVSAADEAAEALILQGLAELSPGIPVIAEEAAARGQVPSFGECFFLVDPLDGTRDFIAGLPEYTVNIAVVVDGAPVLGVVGAPALGFVWRGRVGRAAERLRLPAGKEPDPATERVAIRTRAAPAGLVAAVSRSHLDAETSGLLARLPITEMIACGSSVKFCRVAEGAVDLYPRLAPTMEWDIAAGHAILAAAGGIVTRPDGTPLRYGEPQAAFRIPAFMAWGDPKGSRRRSS